MLSLGEGTRPRAPRRDLLSQTLVPSGPVSGNGIPSRNIVRRARRRLESAQPGTEVDEQGIRFRRGDQRRVGGSLRVADDDERVVDPVDRLERGRMRSSKPASGILQRQVGVTT